MFGLIGQHPGPDISVPATASLAGIGRPQAGTALRELSRASLMTEHVPGRYACHDLLRVYAAEQARAHSNHAVLRIAYRRVLDHFLHTADNATQLLDPQLQKMTDSSPRRGV